MQGSSATLLGVNTSSNVIQAGSATGNGNAVFLGLNNYNTGSSDPAGGFNGAMYYNTTSNQFRCFQSSAWQDCNGSGSLTAIGTFDSQAPQANGLFFSAGTLYAQSASISNPGLVNTSTSVQAFAGPKSFQALIYANCNVNDTATAGSISGSFASGTIDSCSTLSIDQTTANITQVSGIINPIALTLPTPTVTAAGRVVYVINTGTVGISLNGYYIAVGATQQYIYTGSAWQTIGGTSDNTTQTARKSADQTVVSSTTLVNDSDLTFNVGPDETWYFQGNGSLTGGPGGGIQADWQGGTASLTTCSMDINETFNASNATSAACGTTTKLTAAKFTGGSPDVLNIYGTVTTGTTGGTIVFRWAQNSNSGTALVLAKDTFMTAYRLIGADYAEIYYGANGGLTPGDVVSLDGTGPSQIDKSSEAYDPDVVGVVSTQPGQIEGAADGTGQPVPIGLAGRVPVNVDDQNGPIAPGDYLVPSSTPGVAMKATGPGMAIGQALTGFDGPGQGSVMLFIKNTYYPGNNPNVIGLGITSNSVASLDGSTNTRDEINIGSSSGSSSDITIGSTTSGSSLVLQDAGYTATLSARGLGLGGTSVNATADLSFGNGVDRSINVLQASSGNGNDLSITAGQGAGVNDSGGNLVLQAGAAGGSGGSAGSVIARSNGSDSSTNPAFAVQNSNAVDLFAANTGLGLIKIGIGSPTLPSTGLGDLYVTGSGEFGVSLRIGDVQNGFNFTNGIAPSAANGLFNGTSRPIKTIAEIPQFYGMTSSGNPNGTLTNGFDTTANAFHSYYNWTTTQSTPQSDGIYVRVAVPTDFSALTPGDQICYNVYTDDTSGNSKISTTFYDTTDTAQATFDATPSAINSWQQQCTTNIGGTIAVNGNTYFTILINLTAAPNKNVRLGEFTFNYLGAF